MSTPDNDSRDWVERMLLKMREGEATADEVAQLRELLMRDAGARRVYLRTKQTECLLETVPAQQVAAVIPMVTPSSTTAMRRWRGLALASAAAAVVALGVLTFSRIGGGESARDRDAAVAVLRSSFEAVIDGREVLPGEMPMRAGTYRLERGSVQMVFANGANVVIEGPAMFDLVDASTMHLNEGSVWAHCPESARGFAVRMPGGRELVDFGTEFGARVNAKGGAEVKVMQGEVKVLDAVSRPLDLSAGKAANWELTAPPLAVNTASVKPFQTARMLADKVKSAPAVDQQTVLEFNQPRGDWRDAGSWKGGAIPGAHALERAVLNQGRVVRVTPGMPPPAHPVDIHVSNGHTLPTSDPDAILEIAGDMECQMLRIATADQAHGVVRQMGGTFNVTASLLASSHEGSPTLSTYTLSDGALNVGHNLVIGVRGASQFTLVGSKAMITADRMILGSHATLTFALDADGAGLIKLRDTLVQNDQARLVIDGSQYRGGLGRLSLVVCGASHSVQGQFRPQQIQFTGFQGVTPRLAFHPSGIDLVLESVR